MRVRFHLLFLTLCPLLAVRPGALRAEEILYDLRSFGTSSAMVVLQGSNARSVSTQLSGDLKSLRISSIGAGFSRKDERPLGGLFAYQQLTRRGPYLDLMIGFSAPVELEPVAGAHDLKLMIKRRIEEGPALPPVSVKRSDGPAGRQSLQLIFPDLRGAYPLTSYAAGLRFSAYWIDLLYAWAAGKHPPEAPQGEAESSGAERNEELNELVDELTKEIQSLRAALEQCRNGH